MFKACQNGHFDIVQFLVEKCNGNYTRADNEGIVPFHVAAYEGYVVILEYLSQCPSIDVESKNNNGRTALHYASQQGKLPVVKCLIEQCGSRNRDGVDEKNITPLHLAADNGHFDIVKYLCSNKVNCSDPSRRDDFGRTPLHYAAQSGHAAIAKFLVEDYHTIVLPLQISMVLHL